MKFINVNTGFQFIILVIIAWFSVASSRNIDPDKIVSLSKNYLVVKTNKLKSK